MSNDQLPPLPQEPVLDQTSQPINWSSVATKGVILGVIAILVSLAGYLAGPAVMGNFLYSIVTGLGMLVLAVFFARNERKQNHGGYIDFGKAWLILLGMSAISSVFSVAFYGVLVGLIDPELPEKIIDASFAQVASMMGSNMTEEAEAAMEAQKENTIAQLMPTAGNLAMMYIKAVGFGAVFNAIFALFVRRKKEVFN